jgi:hypothetical protein
MSVLRFCVQMKLPLHLKRGTTVCWASSILFKVTICAASTLVWVNRFPGLIAAEQVAGRQFWREECRPCQRRSTRNLPMSEWHRNQSLCRQCSAMQAHMLYQNPSNHKKEGKKESVIRYHEQWESKNTIMKIKSLILPTKHNSRSSSTPHKALPCDLREKKGPPI